MTSQLSIDFNPAHAARRNDPESSKRAARKAAMRVRSVAGRCVLMLARYPGSTSKELASKPHMEIDRSDIARRLPDARRSGYVRSEGDGDEDIRWYLTAKGWKWVEENRED